MAQLVAPGRNPLEVIEQDIEALLARVLEKATELCADTEFSREEGIQALMERQGDVAVAARVCVDKRQKQVSQHGGFMWHTSLQASISALGF